MEGKKRAVIFASRDNPLHGLKEELEKRGMETRLLMREDFRAAGALAEEAAVYGAPDYLVISALEDRRYDGRDILELTPLEYDDWKYFGLRQFYDINAAYIGRMTENGGGSVLGIACEAGLTPSKGRAMAGAAGAALIMGIKCMAEESAEDGIYANAAVIGAVAENGDMSPAFADEAAVLHVPAHRLMDAAAVEKKLADVLLMGDADITGNVITIDAGLSCAYMREW